MAVALSYAKTSYQNYLITMETCKVISGEQRTELVNNAVEDILKYFTEITSFSEMLADVADGCIKVWGDDLDPDSCDGDDRAHTMAHTAKTCLDLLRPFAGLIGQTEPCTMFNHITTPVCKK